MDAATAGGEYARNPTIDDIVDLCRHLNKAGAKYVIIGGFAMIHHGFVRTTAVIDLLVDGQEPNIAKIKEALLYLPDKAAREISPADVQRYVVVRVSDEIVVDLLAKACDVDFTEVRDNIESELVKGVKIPYPTIEMLLKTKQGLRVQDAQDRMYLERILREKRTQQNRT